MEIKKTADTAARTAPGAYSAEFLSAVERVLLDEGGRSNRADDSGGLTNFGISARAYPDLDIAAISRADAIAIYWRDWWLKFRFDHLPPSAVAAKTFNLAVNIGPIPAVRCLQRAVRAAGGARLVEDGELGELTIRAAADLDAHVLLAAIRSEAAGYYRVSAALARGPRADGDRKFLEGWLNRAYR